MPVEKRLFGTLEGKEVYSFFLDNGKGLSAEILNYGGIIRKLVYKDVDVCLGYDTLVEYVDNQEYFGAIIGRNANRIENAEFELNGKPYVLVKNAGEDNLHGGEIGFDRKIWKAEITDDAEPSLVLSVESQDGEEGFPGNVIVMVTYTLTSDNCIRIKYFGESDEDTVLNMTNHTYFNLNGHASGSVGDSYLWLNSRFYTPNKDTGVPNGEIRSVKGTPFDFTAEGMTKMELENAHHQINKFGGIDHNFVLNSCEYGKAGAIKADKTGIIMEIYTDRKGMQVYTANEIEYGMKGKNGAIYSKHCGICFETQAFPNNLEFAHFPRSILKKGEKYESVTSYKFI